MGQGVSKLIVDFSIIFFTLGTSFLFCSAVSHFWMFAFFSMGRGICAKELSTMKTLDEIYLQMGACLICMSNIHVQAHTWSRLVAFKNAVFKLF